MFFFSRWRQIVV